MNNWDRSVPTEIKHLVDRGSERFHVGIIVDEIVLQVDREKSVVRPIYRKPPATSLSPFLAPVWNETARRDRIQMCKVAVPGGAKRAEHVFGGGHAWGDIRQDRV